MSKNLSKYLYQNMDKEAGLQHTFHKTKIVATVGPACDTYDKLLSLVKAGVNVFRLNFSHGSHEDKTKIIEHIRRLIQRNLSTSLFLVICRGRNSEWVKLKAAACS